MKKGITHEKCLMCIILLMGIAVRIVYLGSIPGGYHRDEAYAAWNALSLYMDGIDSSGHSYPVYFEAWAHGQNALNSYMMIPLIALAGGHVNPIVVRIPQVVVSILTMIAVYLLIKKMFSHRLGVWALFCVAICPWHVMMSRWGLESNLAPGFLILGLYFWILGMEKPRWFLLSALCYGLSLYSYATIWPIVPVMVLLQLFYGLWTGKMILSKWLIGAMVILISMGLPLVCFLLVNMGILPEFKIGCFSVYKMTQFRSNELAHSLGQVWQNIKNVGYLLKNQDVGRPYDVIMPYGFFYDLGRVLIVIGTIVVVMRLYKALRSRTFAYEWFIIVQLVGAAIIGCLINVNMTQINCLYLPLLLCEAVGAEAICGLAGRLAGKAANKKNMEIWTARLAAMILVVIFMSNFIFFLKDYYTDYKDLVSAHFQEGTDDAVRYAWECAKEAGFNVGVNSGLKYPNVLLATETGAEEYLDTVVYSEELPAPSSFSSEGVTFYMGIDWETLREDMVYVLYYTDIGYFEEYELTQFFDWYVAVPK